jgi:zinc finger protein-like protein
MKVEVDSRRNDDGSAPLVVFYVQLHDAIRRELGALHVIAVSMESSPDLPKDHVKDEHTLKENGTGQQKPGFPYGNIDVLRQRYRFLEQVYKYHSSIEDEVLYPALDSKVRNVTLAYSIEHEDEEYLLEELSSILSREDLKNTLDRENAHKVARKVEEVHTTLKKHLEKEEEQLLPLLRKHFSIKEQAGLVVQFFCCIPYSAIKPMLSWLLRSLSEEEKELLMEQMKDVIQDSCLKRIVDVWRNPSGRDIKNSGPCSSQPNGEPAVDEEKSPLRQVVYFHDAIRSAMRSFSEEALSLNSSQTSISPEQLHALAERHRFIRAVCHFHSTSEDEILFPVLHEIVGEDGLRHQCEDDHTAETAHFESLGRLLGDVRACARRGAKELSDLISELAAVSQKMSKSMHAHMSREEEQVFPVLMKKIGATQQRYIVWALVQAMPLRLLERFMPWIATQISKKDLDDWLADMERAANEQDGAFLELVQQWASRSIVNVPHDNPAAFPIQTCGPQGISQDNDDLLEDYQRPKRIKTAIQKVDPEAEAQTPDADYDGPIVLVNPIDHIFQFHKALRSELKDLEKSSLELQQAAVAAESWRSGSTLNSMISDLQARFQFLRGIYKAHSRAEDEIVFPALESKETLSNVSHAYSLDHKQEEHLLEEVSSVVTAIEACSSNFNLESLRSMTSKLSKMCAAIRASLETHVRAEEKELWPLFTEHFTIKEQEELVGMIIGQTGAEVLQVMLSWVTKSMTEDERDAMMFSLKSASKSTAFENWLGAQISSQDLPHESPLKACDTNKSEENNNSPAVAFQEHQAILAEVAAYLAKHNISGAITEQQRTNLLESEPTSLDATLFRPGWQDIFRMNQKHLQAAVRRVSADESLEPQRKAYLIQHLMASRYIVAQQTRNPVLTKSQPECAMQHKGLLSSHLKKPILEFVSEEPSPLSASDFKSYHDKSHAILGCKHYARKAVLVSPCCDRDYVCRLCHDEKNVDHKMDRYQVKEMKCMECGLRQPIGQHCSGCGSKLAAYYCSICHLFDDDESKDIYHCPFCNFCRRGKGLGKDSFHCMSCNACMSLELFNKHKCTEEALSGNCPVCSDPLFESNTPIKELPCGHFMHSLCFGAYVRYSYTCPICFKSLGDMEVYWKMLDAMLAAEKMPEGFPIKTQKIRCNDCSAVSEAPFHFVYHKCSKCHGYNTRTVH